ncbi:hypothetical protein NLO413_0249 [Candidatus Neoehrlichia lotoris str. RAC413]|uniref:Uncharacterized protein n=1 Tax=Candidatus Neoehrlichia procyonis str. RAC413 TaxID=1359163 RepID=A0A0F3NLG1_9RICK|nr:hypothetical protein NLO413_0249 [Candidatus Neoehrlichia lotoris str. RAC413]
MHNLKNIISFIKYVHKQFSYKDMANIIYIYGGEKYVKYKVASLC